jgi:two-component system OmpR family response regulator
MMTVPAPLPPGEGQASLRVSGDLGAEGNPLDLFSRILIIDDDAEIRALLEEFLGGHGFLVASAANGQEMDRRLAEAPFDLAVLDIMMPGEDGLSILRRLKAASAMPVIMLSAIGTDIDRIVGLEMGADDYLAKPCNPRELLARIRVALRRAREPEQAAEATAPDGDLLKVLTFAGWRIDLDARLLTDPDDVLISLTDGEFRLLRALVGHPRRTLTRDQLLDLSIGRDTESYDRAIDVGISRLRRKLQHPRSGELIRTVRSEGYIFTPQVKRATA